MTTAPMTKFEPSGNDHCYSSFFRLLYTTLHPSASLVWINTVLLKPQTRTKTIFVPSFSWSHKRTTVKLNSNGSRKILKHNFQYKDLQAYVQRQKLLVTQEKLDIHINFTSATSFLNMVKESQHKPKSKKKKKSPASTEKLAAALEERRKAETSEKIQAKRNNPTTLPVVELGLLSMNATMENDPSENKESSPPPTQTGDKEVEDKLMQEIEEGLEAKNQVEQELRAHIAQVQIQASPSKESDDDSVSTQAQGNKKTNQAQQSRRSVQEGLDGYSRTPSNHVLFCKLKIYTAASETPTAQTRNTFGMILTTLLKINSSVKIYVF